MINPFGSKIHLQMGNNVKIDERYRKLSKILHRQSSQVYLIINTCQQLLITIEKVVQHSNKYNKYLSAIADNI